jgi:hypothetical protein
MPVVTGGGNGAGHDISTVDDIGNGMGTGSRSGIP